MKKYFYAKILTILVLSIAMSSCNKYEQGSKFTLLTAKMRITNEWASTSYSVSSEGGETGDHMDLTIKKDGTYTALGTHLGVGNSSIGTWDFNVDKSKINFYYDGVITTWKITRLKNSYLNLVRTEDISGEESITAINFEAK